MKQKTKAAVNRVSGGKGRLGVRYKLFLYLAVFTAMILLILWLTQVIFLPDIYKTVKVGELKISARALSERVTDDNFREEAELLASRGDMCILVLHMLNEDTALEVVSVDTLPFCMIHNTDRNSKFTFYDMAIENGGEILRHFRFDRESRLYYSVDEAPDDLDDANEYILYTILTEKDGETYMLMLNSIISPVSATTKTLNLILIAVSLMLLILSAVFAFIISRRITRPIVSINDSAKQLAAGDYNVRFTEGGYREISELAGTLNYAADELGKVDGLRKELIANISHDLRTPLTMIQGYAELMRDIPGENTPENEQSVIDETQRLTSLVNDMLDLSKYESGNQTADISECNITVIIRDLLTRYNSFCEKDGYRLEFSYDEELTMRTDSTKVVQAVYNLVNNAITYTGEDKTVRVGQYVDISRDGVPQTVRFTVSDSGEGIPADKLESIWERYYKVDKVHRRASVGTGLGLSIVKNIAIMLGGRYGVESEIGKGSVFWIELPVNSKTNIQPDDNNTDK